MTTQLYLDMTKRWMLVAAFRYFVVVVVVVTTTTTASTAAAGSCNICGDGNVIGAPDTTFKFSADEGNERELGCQQVQALLDTGTVPETWCDLVSPYAVGPCRCQTPDGTLIESAVQQGDSNYCNICGPADSRNFIGEAGAVVNLQDPDGLVRKFPCSELQSLANTPNVFPAGFCAQIQSQALVTCRCTTPDGVLLSDAIDDSNTDEQTGDTTSTTTTDSTTSNGDAEETAAPNDTNGSSSEASSSGTIRRSTVPWSVLVAAIGIVSSSIFLWGA